MSRPKKTPLILSTRSVFCSVFILLFGAADLSVFKKKKKESKQLKGMREKVRKDILNARCKNTMKKKRQFLWTSPVQHLE